MAERFVISKSVAEAASLKNKSTAFLAGGTEINRLDSTVKAKTLVSLSKIGLKGVTEFTCEECGLKMIRVGAMTTFQELVDCAMVPEYLKKACLFMSSRQKRDMATIGGNIGSLRDDSYLIATLLAAKAKLELVSPKGKKTNICICRYVSETEKYEDCLITAVLLPQSGVAVETKRYSNTAASHGYLTVSASEHSEEKVVAVCAKNSGIYFFKNEKPGSIKFKDDIYGSPAYKKYLLDVTVEDLQKKVSGGEK